MPLHIRISKVFIGMVFCFFSFLSMELMAQVKLGGNDSQPNTSAILELESINKGLLLPRIGSSTLSNIDRFPSPARGLLVLDSSQNRLVMNLGTPANRNWQAFLMVWDTLALSNRIHERLALTGGNVTGPVNLATLTGNVGIGTTNPDASATLHLVSNSKGFLLPRIGTSDLNSNNFASPASGLLAFDTNKNRVVMNAGTPAGRNWQGLILASDTLSLQGRLNNLASGSFTNLPGSVSFFKRSGPEGASGSANFFVWNAQNGVNFPSTFYQSIVFGHKAGNNAEYSSHATIKYTVSVGQYPNNHIGAIDNWYGKVEHFVTNKSAYLSFDTDQKMILGKGDQDNKSMLINATGYYRLGVVSIGHRNPDVSALLDLNFVGPAEDLGKGLLLPRYSNATLNNNNFYNPAKGLLAYDLTNNRVVMNLGDPATRNWQAMLLATDTLSLSNRISQRLALSGGSVTGSVHLATTSGNVGIGTSSPDPSALLNLVSSVKGFLLPSISTENLNSANFVNPSTGLLAFDQTRTRVVMNAGTPAARNWQALLLPKDTLSLSDRINQRLPLSGGTVTGSVHLATVAGNVGIGMDAPTEKLEVSGNLKVSGTVEGNKLLVNQSAGKVSLADNEASISVNHTNVTSNSLIILTSQDGNAGHLFVSNLQANVGFTINTTISSGIRSIGYLIIN